MSFYALSKPQFSRISRIQAHPSFSPTHLYSTQNIADIAKAGMGRHDDDRIILLNGILTTRKDNLSGAV